MQLNKLIKKKIEEENKKLDEEMEETILDIASYLITYFIFFCFVVGFVFLLFNYLFYQ
jgi:hypothetical protein